MLLRGHKVGTFHLFSLLPPTAFHAFAFLADWGDGHFVGIVRVLDRICAKAELGGVTPHVLRHTFASVAGDLGFSELTIAGLLGHSARGVTHGYVHLDRALIVEADQVAGEIARLLDGDTAGARRGEVIEAASMFACALSCEPDHQRVCPPLGVKPPYHARSRMRARDPNIWSGRASQENLIDLQFAVLHQYIRPLIGARAPSHHGYQRACDLISGQASTGPFGSPVLACAGKTDPPSRLILSQTSAGRVCGLHHRVLLVSCGCRPRDSASPVLGD